jgi:hypothetical protein
MGYVIWNRSATGKLTPQLWGFITYRDQQLINERQQIGLKSSRRDEILVYIKRLMETNDLKSLQYVRIRSLKAGKLVIIHR